MSSNPTFKIKGIFAIMWGFLGGILGGVISWFITDYLVIGYDFIAESRLKVVSTDSRQGRKSLEWNFQLQPERRYRYSEGQLIGAFAHLEVLGNIDGKLRGFDLSGYQGIKFWAKTTNGLAPIK